MKKSDIAHAVYASLGGFSKKEATDLVDMIFDSMKETLGRGEKVKLSSFGNFVLRDKKARSGRNPVTGEPIALPSRRVLVFKPSPGLRELLNPPSDMDPTAEPTPLPETTQTKGK